MPSESFINGYLMLLINTSNRVLLVLSLGYMSTGSSDLDKKWPSDESYIGCNYL